MCAPTIAVRDAWKFAPPPNAAPPPGFLPLLSGAGLESISFVMVDCLNLISTFRTTWLAVLAERGHKGLDDTAMKRQIIATSADL